MQLAATHEVLDEGLQRSLQTSADSSSVLIGFENEGLFMLRVVGFKVQGLTERLMVPGTGVIQTVTLLFPSY